MLTASDPLIVMSRSQDRGGNTDAGAVSCRGIHTIVVGVQALGRCELLPAVNGMLTTT